MINMDNQLNGLPLQQACESAPKIQETGAIMKENTNTTEDERECAKRFSILSVGCFLYALLYTFCLYNNKSGITYPFFVGGVLCFFGYYLKKFGATAAKDRNFLLGAVILLGILNCTTDSSVLISLNRFFIVLLTGVWLLESLHDSTSWKPGTWITALTHLLGGSLIRFYKPVEDAYWRFILREKKDNNTSEHEAVKKKIIFVLLGVGISFPVLFVIVLLLGSADALFWEMICDVWDALFSWNLWEFFIDGNCFWILFMLISSFALVYGLLTYAGNRKYIDKAVKIKETEWDSYIAIAFLSMITIVYCLFCGIQIFGLFLGQMELPEGYTYAEYARQGFFQLLFVCLFNICLVLGCLGFFKKNKWLKIMLTIISGCTYIMIASSAYRMILYISSYQLTFLRVFVLWALLMIALAFIGIILYIWNHDFGLFRYLLITVTAGYFIFAAIHPDYWIARYNIDQYAKGEDIDFWYVTYGLSLDAAPAVYDLADMEHPSGYMEGVVNYLDGYDLRVNKMSENMTVRNWNLSRANAVSYIKK